MRRTDPMPRVWLAAGAVTDPRALVRFGWMGQVPVPVGPVVIESDEPWATGQVHGTGPGGVEHAAAAGIQVIEAIERLRWCAGRDLSALVTVRGSSATEMAGLVGRLCNSLDGDAVGAVEVDLRGADDQTALKVMARIREAAPRDLLILARLSALQPDLVGSARGAVAGGAGAIVVCGSLRLGSQRWWSGPSTAAACRAGLRTLVEAGRDNRWPSVPLVGAGGVHDVASAVGHLEAGAVAVQLGSALWADPTLVHQIGAALSDLTLDHHDKE